MSTAAKYHLLFVIFLNLRIFIFYFFKSIYRTFSERVEALRKKKMEWEAASRSAKSRGSSEVARKEPTKEELSSDDDSEEIFAVDWRAQHL